LENPKAKAKAPIALFRLVALFRVALFRLVALFRVALFRPGFAHARFAIAIGPVGVIGPVVALHWFHDE
jgi:hypothetical protein